MSTSAQDEQRERQRVFAQDQSLRGSTFHQHALADANTPQGRFSAHAAATVIGSKARIASAYPAASAAHQTELPPEPPTGYAIDAMPDLEVTSLASSPQAPDPTSDAPLTPLGRDVGSFSQSGGLTSEVLTHHISQPPRVGSPVRHRRY